MDSELKDGGKLGLVRVSRLLGRERKISGFITGRFVLMPRSKIRDHDKLFLLLVPIKNEILAIFTIV